MARLSARLKKLHAGTEDEPAEPSTFGLIVNGYFTTVGGQGPMLQNFLRNLSLGNYSGRGIIAKMPNEPQYNRSRMRFLPFDHCFQKEKKLLTSVIISFILFT